MPGGFPPNLFLTVSVLIMRGVGREGPAGRQEGSPAAQAQQPSSPAIQPVRRGYFCDAFCSSPPPGEAVLLHSFGRCSTRCPRCPRWTRSTRSTLPVHARLCLICRPAGLCSTRPTVLHPPVHAPDCTYRNLIPVLPVPSITLRGFNGAGRRL